MKVVAATDHARLAAPSREPAAPDAVTVVLGDGHAPEGHRSIRWFGGARGPRAGDELWIAPEGESLWRRAPWPAADALFDLPPPPPGAGVVVAGGSAARRVELLATVRDRGIRVREEALLTPAAVADAGSVVLLPAADLTGDALPLETMAVLAARRLLIAPRAGASFGLIPGIDYLGFTLSSEAADLAEAARRRPAAFERMRAWGTIAARRHRATDVFAALGRDLALRAGA